jgi:hypothetical protein
VKNYKSTKGHGVLSILGITAVYDLLIITLLFIVNSYEISTLLKITIIVFNLYQIYYILIYSSLEYSIDDYNIYIKGSFGLKNLTIPFKDIKGYKQESGHIKGIKLSGYGKNHFAIGRAIIKKIGSTYMFVTSTKNVIYLKTDDANYGLSPENFNDFKLQLNNKNIYEMDWEYKPNKNINLYKDKKFFIPFLIVAVVVLVITFNPIILYLNNRLPNKMPLSFNSNFIAVEFGTNKQFAFKQMFYGLLNMAVLFCMYNAAYLYARYDRKSVYKFIYIPLILSSFFLVVQIRILSRFI